jgi:hypothetical protein
MQLTTANTANTAERQLLAVFSRFTLWESVEILKRNFAVLAVSPWFELIPFG